MAWLFVKYLLTAGIIMLISETVKRSEKMGALFTALPIITFSVLIWMYLEKEPMEKIGNYMGYLFWYVLPTLPMLLMFPLVLGKIGFWGTLGLSAVVTIGCFGVEVVILKRFGIELL